MRSSECVMKLNEGWPMVALFRVYAVSEARLCQFNIVRLRVHIHHAVSSSYKNLS